MVKPTDLLKEEHREVKLSLQILEHLCESIAGDAKVQRAQQAADFARLIDFFKVFVDKCHHAKEEEVLFPALLDAGLPKEGGPVQVMLAEHVTGRRLVAEMDEALQSYRSGTASAAPALAKAGQSYAALLASHIDKEDNVLYWVADSRIPADVQAEMPAAFDKIERERIGLGTHERFHSLLHELKAAYLSGGVQR